MLLRRWLQINLDGAPAAFAVKARTGWRFVVEELPACRVEAPLAEPADTAAARGPKRRAKTDRTDAWRLAPGCWPPGGRPSRGLRPSRCWRCGRATSSAPTTNHCCRIRGGQRANPYRNPLTCTSVGM